MASGGHRLQQEKTFIESKIKGLVNQDLKEICKAYDYQVSGTKAVLQKRCLEILENIVRTGDVQSFEELRYRTNNHGRSPPQNLLDSAASQYPTPSYQPYNMAPQRGGGGQNRLPTGGKYFKPSPFYEVIDTLLQLQDLPEGPEMPQNRHTVRSSFTIRPEVGDQFRRDNLKILMYCGMYHAMSPLAQVDVAFPNQIEVKVNDNDVKANFKGLKNKAGSTKPADITSLVRKYQAQQNTVQVTYALTTKRYAFAVYLVRAVSADTLTERIKRHSVIRKQKVLDAMNAANADPDIAATSIRMSLKDPVSTMRITLPVRSSHCTHNQCFDGAMFLQLQEQAPQWSCPVCSKTVPFESLCIDEYFQEILDKTAKWIEKVDIEPNGEWRVIKEEDDSQTNATSSRKARASYDDDFDDDLVEVDQPGMKQVNGVKRESYLPMMPSPISAQSFPINTPPLSSRATSVAQSTTSTQRSNKRPQGAIIDLTLSDDDEDEQPPRPAKRQTTHRHSQSNHTSLQNNNQVFLPDPRPQNQNYSRAQADSYRPPSNHNHLPQPNFNGQSLSPPAAFGQPSWPGPTPRSPVQHHTAANNSSFNNGGIFPPNSPFAIRPPPQPEPQNSAYSPGQGQHGGLRLPPMNAPSPSGQNTYQSAWRSDYNDYGSYSQSPG